MTKTIEEIREIRQKFKTAVMHNQEGSPFLHTWDLRHNGLITRLQKFKDGIPGISKNDAFLKLEEEFQDYKKERDEESKFTGNYDPEEYHRVYFVNSLVKDYYRNKGLIK
jgi:hypothetical protein